MPVPRKRAKRTNYGAARKKASRTEVFSVRVSAATKRACILNPLGAAEALARFARGEALPPN